MGKNRHRPLPHRDRAIITHSSPAEVGAELERLLGHDVRMQWMGCGLQGKVVRTPDCYTMREEYPFSVGFMHGKIAPESLFMYHPIVIGRAFIKHDPVEGTIICSPFDTLPSMLSNNNEQYLSYRKLFG